MDRLGLYMRSQFPIIQDSAWSSPLACSVVKPGNWVSKHEKTKDKRASKKTNNWDNTLPHLFHPPSCIIHNKAIWCGSLSQHPLPPARHQPHLLIPSAVDECPFVYSGSFCSVIFHTLLYWMMHLHLWQMWILKVGSYTKT